MEGMHTFCNRPLGTSTVDFLTKLGLDIVASECHHNKKTCQTQVFANRASTHCVAVAACHETFC